MPRSMSEIIEPTRGMSQAPLALGYANRPYPESSFCRQDTSCLATTCPPHSWSFPSRANTDHRADYTYFTPVLRRAARQRPDNEQG